jgi:NAD+ kinase
MSLKYAKIGIIGQYRKVDITDTVLSLIDYLKSKHIIVYLESNTANKLSQVDVIIVAEQDLAQHCDLIIVVGGDGSLLTAARCATVHNVPLVGINRGYLGFLTDIHPDTLVEQLSAILQGHYIEEKRFLLTATLQVENHELDNSIALNDVVLFPSSPQMIEFEIYIDQQFVCSQRSDGLIIATPTGSTAYALSGGGPILHPALNAMVLVPMFPHTLTSRPLVISGESCLDIIISDYCEVAPLVSYDGSRRIELPISGRLHIKKHDTALRLIHPKGYNYFETLRTKLHWGKKL